MISSSSMTRIVPRRAVVMMSMCNADPIANHCLGQRHGEAGSLPHNAVAMDQALVLANDAVGDRQAQTSAATHRLGGEERIVNPREQIGSDARPGVRNLG